MLGKILNITSLQNPIIKDLTKIIRGNNQNAIKSFVCEGEFFLKSAFKILSNLDLMSIKDKTLRASIVNVVSEYEIFSPEMSIRPPNSKFSFPILI